MLNRMDGLPIYNILWDLYNALILGIKWLHL